MYIYNGIFSAREKKEFLSSVATQMDPEKALLWVK